ncbi:hypothetical protein [Gemmatimonas sp. UBA7669]|uniref:hypothetical protein n=1 Tax=Gemmatimonas sp. UBA7669 TaxID=1946568 RepID=UPI0025BFB002|nr:hypothetical protein [Gemmatimonas sp. UBA7669]
MTDSLPPASPRSRMVRRLLIAVSALLAAGLGSACAGAPPVAEVPVPDVSPVQVAVDTAAPTPADGMSADFHARFARNDVRARAIVYWMQCTATVARLRAEGRFGPAARAPRAIHCSRTSDGVPIGGVFDIDSSFARVQRLGLVRLDGARPAYTDAVDTTAIAAAFHLARDVHRQVNRSWTTKKRPFSVVPIATPALEAWVIPRATKARSYVVGGDMGFARAATSDSLQLLDDHSATWTQLNLTASGPLRLFSSVRDVAAVTDLVTARWYAELGRGVSLSTPAAVSTLEAGFDPATGARLVWRHTPVTK